MDLITATFWFLIACVVLSTIQEIAGKACERKIEQYKQTIKRLEEQNKNLDSALDLCCKRLAKEVYSEDEAIYRTPEQWRFEALKNSAYTKFLCEMAAKKEKEKKQK